MDLDSQLSLISRRRIFFGHQSVGLNILGGVSTLMSQRSGPSAAQIIEIHSGGEITGLGIFHSKIGKNRDITSKFTHFEKLLVDNGIGEKVEFALMKLCYVDFAAHSDSDGIFDQYQASLRRIQDRFPRLLILACTAPLTVNGPGIRRQLRNWLKGDGPNIQRCRFNDLLRKNVPPERIFDIAMAESTRPDGSKLLHRHRETSYCTAYRGYMEGAGHLNAAGSLYLARRFVETLAAACETWKS